MISSPSPADWPAPAAAAEIVISRQRIARRVRRLGQEITRRYRGRELTVLAVLSGAMVFLADLLRQVPLPLRLQTIGVSSYPGAARQSVGPSLLGSLPQGLQDRHVLVVDDVLDSGQTLQAILDAVAARRPDSLAACVLLRKARPDLPDRRGVDFAGFDVGAGFLVGYGLDYDGLYRNLPDVWELPAVCPEKNT